MALNPLVSLIGRLVARSGRKRGNRQTDRQNDKTTTVTLAVNVRRGLIMYWILVSLSLTRSGLFVADSCFPCISGVPVLGERGLHRAKVNYCNN